MAGDRVDGGLALPALTGYFAGNGLAVQRDSFDEFLGQIKIATDASVVGTVDAEHRPGLQEIGRVFDLAILGDALGVVVTKF